MQMIKAYAVPIFSAVVFAYALSTIFTDDPVGTAAQGGMSVAVFVLFFGAGKTAATLLWLAVAAAVRNGNLARARVCAVVALIWLVVDAILSVTWWPTYEGNDLILAALLGLGLFQVLYIATVLNEPNAPAGNTGGS